MKLNYNAALTTPKGEAIENSSLGAFLYDVCLTPEQDMSGDKKLKLARLAKKIVDEAELTVEEVALLKERALKYATAAVIMSVDELLEGRE